ncbi:MAG: NapC/NirT family cytochrome c [Terriglobales bacterium]|jgi:nitrate/TMAO reductase-like tetraheme cytochrome c subunit
MPEDSSSAPLPVAGLARIANLIRNPISIVGLALAVVALGNILFLFFIDVTSPHPSPYVGILAYMIAPGFLVLGLALAIFGAFYYRRKRLESVGVAPYVRLDFSDPSQRGAVAFFLAFMIVFVGMSVVGSYKAYNFTDSVGFCGQLCHSVMNPEFVAYQQSPHARVACVDCHVGAGATWYVKSKLSGARQVFKTALNTFPRPIPTPVQNLRPASETCEACHWPKKFFGAQLKVFNHYNSDENNTPLQIRLLIKTGGGDPSAGEPEGIHWHVDPANEVTYVASDEERQAIAYVRVKNAQGAVTEYYAKDSKLTKDEIGKAVKRRMDCVDCHNRPTHIYTSPEVSVDRSITAHHLDISLPFLKQQAVAALTGKYENTDAAMQGIAKTIGDFYATKYPDLSKTRQPEIHGAIDEVQSIYKLTFFPEMKVDWRTHPNNIGHLYFNGCFRCHDDNHVSAEGKVIPKDCNLCHTVLVEQEKTVNLASLPGVQFKHPVDLGDMTAVTCTDCHTGGVSP